MLSKITIQNFALIQHLNIELGRGLQVITGETGAGKSIILGALRLILGERADVKAIANPEEKSIVEAEFKINKSYLPFFEGNDLDFDEYTLIRREILPSGKSRAFINDVPVTLDVLKELSLTLIDIHSQFETSKPFSEEYQFKILDGLSENQQGLLEYQSEFKDYQKLNQKLQGLQYQLENANKELDYQKFLLTELEEADLDNLNFEELKNQVSVGENAEYILENLGYLSGRLHQEELGVLASLNEMRGKLQKISSVPSLEEISKRLDEAYIEIKDIADSIDAELEKVEINPEALAGTLSQLNKVNSLLLKHQTEDIKGLIRIREELVSQQKSSEDLELDIEDIRRELGNSEKKLSQIANSLSENRKKSIPVLTQKVESLLGKLGLEKARLQVVLTPEEGFNKFGKEKIQFLFQANTGFPLKPIHLAISGGERSRVMLSIKKIMAENSELPTLILDEIDSGVSGKTADEIGKVMKEMAKNMQLIVITHHAQVAAKGDNHYKVMKREMEGRTQSTIVELNMEEKVNEVAQILSGSTITEAAILQAKELMKN